METICLRDSHKPDGLYPLPPSRASCCSLPFAHSSDDQLVLPDLSSQSFFGMNGHTLLTLGLIIAVLGIVFGLVIYGQLQRLPVHRSMLEVPT